MDSESALVKQRELDSLSQKLNVLSDYGDKLRSILSEQNTAVDTSKMNLRPSVYEDEFTHSFVINSMSTKYEEKLKFNRNTVLPYFIQGSISRGFNPGISHYGLDVATEAYEPISAFADGTVLFADWSSRYGYVIIMEHGDLTIFYKHCGKIFVSYGESVRRGEVVALVGNTGTESQDAHLHFEIWQDGTPKDPSRFVQVNTVVHGNIQTTNHLRIDGKLGGHIESNTNVAISEVGAVLGDIKALNLKVSGKITGNIEIKEKLTVDSHGIIEGDVKTSILVVEEGGKISGRVEMRNISITEGEGKLA
ncbi:hypothetical protein CHS0354_000804 [Potamilus streckersoni]|uniref:M23ase beta-sheet core domain-containing protein n=1 Tax=Potamilus streckersoni TaxID=2493646 RepID=A0AAE0T788_9BIVA|nr:hypothetical protein CHS0354_000804 [Potamilus streckersoni]